VDARHPPSGGPSSVGPSAADRLDSWKAIAVYLKRDVRTVQRWEATEGLPVYRHQHSRHGSIYAYKSEIEAWWEARQPAASRQRQAETDQPQRRGRASLEISYPQLAVYAALIVALTLAIAMAQQMLHNRRAAPSMAAHPRPPTIAILPFQSLSNTSADNNLALDITEHVITDCSQSKELRVVDPSLVSHFEGSTGSPQQIAQLLHSDKLLRGTVGHSGDSVRITAQLIDPASGNAVWSRQFERKAAELPEIEDEIANAIATDIASTLGHDDRPQR
jgi:TolB-like protein